jgi:hypothetical protein
MADVRGFEIFIDKQHFVVREASITGRQLRDLTQPPIPDTRDLYEEVPGGNDILILSDATYAMKNGLHFFTAPSNINPGYPA